MRPVCESESTKRRGRQIADMIYEHFRIAGAHEAVLDKTDLLSVSLQSDDIQDFDGAMVEYHPTSPNDQSRILNLARTNYQESFLAMS